MAKLMLGVEDLEEILGRKSSYCYRVMRELNKELEEQGYYTINGKIPAKYFYERLGIDSEENDE